MDRTQSLAERIAQVEATNRDIDQRLRRLEQEITDTKENQ